DEAPPAATALVGSMKLFVPLAGLIDVAKERERLGRLSARAQADRDKLTTKLAKPPFVDKAPADVVAKDRERLAEVEEKLNDLKEQARRLDDL
ncbi:MAG: hypothetical protein AAFX58_11810, partial [Pseudomonadota bacterium]